jgi:hypothetical protein
MVSTHGLHIFFINIDVLHKFFCLQVYRHSPAITFIQLVCDFGGLGGLWLGFSVITITTAIISLISKPLERIVDRNDDDLGDEKKKKKKSKE